MAFKEKFAAKQDVLMKYAPAGCVVFSLCFFLAPSSKALNNSYYILVLAPTVLIINRIGLRELWKSFHFKVFTFFCLWMASSLIWCERQKFSEIKYVFYIYLYVLAITWAYKNRSRISQKFIYAFAIIATIVPAIAFYISKFVRGEERLKLIDLHGMFETALTAGNSLCFFIIVTVALLFRFKERNIRIGLFIALLSMINLLIYTNSRSSLAAAIIGGAVYIVAKYASKKFIYILIASVAIMTIVLFMFLHAQNWFRWPGENQGNIEYVVKAKDIQKIVLAKRAIEEIQWRGSIQSIAIDGDKVDFNDDLSIEIPVSKKEFKLNLVADEFGLHPFRCITIGIVNSSGEMKILPIEPPRLLYIDPSLNIRTTTWSLFLEELKESPVLGHGLSQRRAVYIPERDISYKDTHNMMLGTAMRGGLVALLMWLIFIIYTFIVLIRSRQDLLLGLFACGTFFTLFDDDNFFKAPLPYWLCMLIPLACSFVIDARGKSDFPNQPPQSSEEEIESGKLNDTICVTVR